MKGTFFQRPLEFRIEIDGESWSQGDTVKGRLTVKNHGPEAVSVADVQVHLAHGALKKVRQKLSDAFETLETRLLTSPSELGAGQEASLDWSFSTERNSPITDNSSSLFILYGKGTSTDQLGQLQLHIQPYSLILEFLDTFLTQFRFVTKSQKFTKGQVEVKLTPPDSKTFATLEHLLVYFRFDEETLEIRYVFKVKKIEATAAAFDVKKQKKDFTQSLPPNEYRLTSGRVNHERLESAIKEALALVESKVLY